MKKYFIGLFILFGLAACQNEKEYKLTITLKQKSILSGGMEETKKEETIKAVNDSLAYHEAVISFDSWEQTYKMTESSEFASIPISFILKDEKGIDVSVKLSALTKQSIEDHVHNLTSETSSRINNSKRSDSLIEAEENKAIGDIYFNMDEKTVDKLVEDFYKKSKRKDSDPYNKFIGNFSYSTIQPSFHEGSLYSLYIVGDYVGWEYYRDRFPAT